MEKKLYHSPFNIAVLAAGLGFFIDAFDLFLFNVYRIPSLKELGLSGQELTRTGEYLLSVQMLGMMIGGLGSWNSLVNQFANIFCHAFALDEIESFLCLFCITELLC